MSQPRRKPQDLGLDVTACRVLADSWMLSLRAERKSEQTLKAYSDGLRFYLDWAEEHAEPPMSKRTLNAWIADLLDAGAKASTAASRQLAVRRFSAWATDEDELDTDPFLGLKRPKIDTEVIEPLTDAELRAIIATCAVAKGAEDSVKFRNRRDEAIIRFMFETAARAGETVALGLADVSVHGQDGTATIRRGKGGKGRIVPFGPDTALALDRYLRLRPAHRLASTPALWLGDRGKGFTYDALHKTLTTRALAAGVEGFHPHRLRHTAAHRWLAAGGSEGGLMAVAGWARPDMLLRYTRAQASARAAEEARRLNLGQL